VWISLPSFRRFYDSEINVAIGWFWDGGIQIRLGDETNGFEAEETLPDVAAVIPWLQLAIAHFYPNSTYAQSLSPETRARAVASVFVPPQLYAREICPRCGAGNASQVMEESFVFACARCGESVDVKKPRPQ